MEAESCECGGDEMICDEWDPVSNSMDGLVLRRGLDYRSMTR